jgi:hypothetical protein
MHTPPDMNRELLSIFLRFIEKKLNDKKCRLYEKIYNIKVT